MANARNKINVISLDFDDCVFNPNYVSKGEYDLNPGRLINTNKVLLDHLSKKITNNNYNQAILMVGSNRQDKETDDRNTGIDNEGSCVPALVALVGELNANHLDNSKVKCTYDGYLLADCFADNSKLILLYAQMHKIASENPFAEIDFDFYDDDRTILSALDSFFVDHPEMIPNNVKLRLNQYADKSINPFPPAKGTGLIDYNYENNLLKIIQNANINIRTNGAEQLVLEEDDQHSVNIVEEISKEKRLQSFLNQRQTGHSTPTQQIEELNKLIEIVASSVHIFIEDENVAEDGSGGLIAIQPNITNKNKFINHLRTLRDELDADMKAQQDKGIPQAKIQTSTAMKIAKETCIMLTNISNTEYTKEEKVEHIRNYELNCRKFARWTNFWKSIAVIAMIAVGIVVGAVAGAAIGIAAGAWSGPGAVATGFVGLFTGAATGASIGLTVGAAVAGTVAGSITAGLLFSDTPITAAVTLTTEFGTLALGGKSRFAD